MILSVLHRASRSFLAHRLRFIFRTQMHQHSYTNTTVTHSYTHRHTQWPYTQFTFVRSFIRSVIFHLFRSFSLPCLPHIVLYMLHIVDWLCRLTAFLCKMFILQRPLVGMSIAKQTSGNFIFTRAFLFAY